MSHEKGTEGVDTLRVSFVHIGFFGMEYIARSTELL